MALAVYITLLMAACSEYERLGTSEMSIAICYGILIKSHYLPFLMPMKFRLTIAERIVQPMLTFWNGPIHNR